ncbi:MAG: hypothetical protein H0T49_09820, partial [Chloroflexia bacterium]|nr:hypothetical protein [Chloroflexia bacterium]
MPDRFHCGYGRVIGALLTFLIVLTPPLVAAGGLSPMTPRLAAAQAPPAGPVIVLLQPNTNAAQLAALA